MYANGGHVTTVLNTNTIINNYSYIITSAKIWNLKDKIKQNNQLNNRVGD